jgi:hypothetical protein
MKNLQYQILRKSFQLETEEINTKGRTDMTTLTARFSATHANVTINAISLLLLLFLLLLVKH